MCTSSNVRSRWNGGKRPLLAVFRNAVRFTARFTATSGSILRTRYLAGTICRTLCVPRKVLLSVRGIVSLAGDLIPTRKPMIYATARARLYHADYLRIAERVNTLFLLFRSIDMYTRAALRIFLKSSLYSRISGIYKFQREFKLNVKKQIVTNVTHASIMRRNCNEWPLLPSIT